jgi:hypothetical protein
MHYKELWLQQIWLWSFTPDGEIWHLKPFYTESVRFQSILYVVRIYSSENVRFGSNNYSRLVNYEVLDFYLFVMADILNFSII